MLSLYDTKGNRKYLVESEREKFMLHAREADNEVRTFCLLLYYTGVRISEGLQSDVTKIDYENKSLIVRSLKKGKIKHGKNKGKDKVVFRSIPLPDSLLDELQMVHNIRKRQKLKKAGEDKIWSWSRNTAYLKVIEVMNNANINGIHACPKGLRHSFAIHCLDKGIPLNMVSKWLGHSSLEVTAIYANAQGEEERKIASRIW